MENRVNVLYLTTKCNLACDYCYEEASRLDLPEQVSVTENSIDSYLYEIAERERGVTSTVVIMGGEPFMKFDLLEYTIKKMGEFRDHKWGVSIVTNATLFNDELSYVKSLILNQKKNVSMTFELSYDVSGHFRRVYRNSNESSQMMVESTIQRFIDNKIPFKISYTLHKDNYNNFIQDMVYIFERFGTKYITAVKVSVYCQELSEHFDSHKKAVDLLKPYAEVITRKYVVPICDFVCGTECFICDRSNFVGKTACGPAGIKYDEMSTEKVFDSWRENE